MTRRILTIDGGGLKGVFPAAMLATLEAEIGRPVASYFDLIAGTSTGGIIALALGLGTPAADILSLYRDTGHQIFPKKRFGGNFGLLRAKYSNVPLRQILAGAFGEKRLGESAVRLLIPSMDLAAERVHVYKTSHHPDLVRDYKLSAVEVALATVAAPTYFPVHVSAEGMPYVDGSLFARNPLGLAVVEAIGVLQWPRDEIRVLSLGCTSTHLGVGWQKRISLGGAHWAAKIADVFMKAQSSSSIVTAHALIGAANVVRINPDMSHHRFTMDGAEHMPLLEQLGRHEAHLRLPELKPVFFTHRAERFVPSHGVQTRSESGQEALAAFS
jgi:uncharacterized protein